MKSGSIKTKALALAICVLFLASAYSWEFATGYTGSIAGWSEDIRLTTDSAYSQDPAIAVDTNNNVHITWNDYKDGNPKIYYTKLDNNGNTLVDDTPLTTASSYSEYPTIAVDTNNNVHITWFDYRDGNWEIYYMKLDNNGNTLVDDTRLTTASAHSYYPTIAVDTNNNVHITWQDYRDGNREIYYTKLDNNGNTLVDDTPLTTDSASSWVPAIAVDTNNNVHITWFDERDGNNEIYYKYSIASDTPPTVATNAATSVGTTSATLNGNLASTGGLDCQVWFEYGTTTSYGSSTTQVSKTSTGAFSANISGLNPSATYHFRAVASNTNGTDYGADMNFTTSTEADTTPPVISSVTSSSITTSSATITWNTDELSDSRIKYSTTSGIYPYTGYDATDVTSHSISLMGLSASSTYYYVVNSTDPSGNSAESSEYSFNTSEALKVFDTGKPANPYPSISGTHNGTITPNQTIEVQKLYTYPCTGTGGHTEYVKVWNSTGWNVTATWEGYQGDWRNITFGEPFTLKANEEYNYTIVTGSYPQIHHNRTLLTENGWINCTEFTDDNGKVYDDWIPAIKLW